MTLERNSAWVSLQQPALVVSGMNRSEALSQKDECASASCKNVYRALARLRPPGYECNKPPVFACPRVKGVGVLLALAVSVKLFQADGSSAQPAQGQAPVSSLQPPAPLLRSSALKLMYLRVGLKSHHKHTEKPGLKETQTSRW